MKKIIKAVLFVAIFTSLLFLLFIFSAVLLEYRPQPSELAYVVCENSLNERLPASSITLLSYNIGYCGLGEDADFFMDGGTSARFSDIDTVKKNMYGIGDILKKNMSDIILLQEVDRHSRRSFYIDQAEYYSNLFSGYESQFALNFKVFFVPIPIYDPIGKVESGVMTVSRFKTEGKGRRYQLPGSFSWPNRMFNLKRSVLVNRFIDESGNEWVLLNLHLSAYDDGNLREKELEFIRNYILEEYNSGRFVIAGGDWNHILPRISKDTFSPYTTKEKDLFWVKELPENWTPEGWTWAIDRSSPTVRSNESGYSPGQNFTTVIDGFLLSPNIELIKVKTINTRFKYSDHEPVLIKVRAKEYPETDDEQG